jgi:hypothetical protein
MTPIRKQKYGNDWSIFLPSISQMYVLAHSRGWDRQPVDMKMLDFLDENNASHFHYPYGLYSAGHAHLDLTKSDEREPMIQKRDKQKTIMVGDSGGFQAATGVLDFDWENPMGEKAVAQRIELMRWLEHTSEYSMVLDWPTWAINTGRLPSTLMICDPTTGDNTAPDTPGRIPMTVTNDPFNNCMNGTIWNNEFFIKHRVPGATKFLNVLHGRSVEEAHIWYDNMSPFSDKKKYGDRAFEGWALGGSTGGDPGLAARLIVRLRDDNLLDGDDRWIHVLGRSRLTTSAYLTILNQALKKHVNPGIQVSFDAASAFLYAVNGNYVVDKNISPKGLNLVSAEFPMHSKFIDSNEPMIYNLDADRLNHPNHYKSPVSKLLTMGDFILPPDEKSKKDYRMDTASYYYIMAHNVQSQLEAIEEVNRRLDGPDAIDHIPTIFLEYRDFINRVLTSETPMSIIEKEADRYSDMISGGRGGVSAIDDQTMFPKTATLDDLDFSKRKNTKPVKSVLGGSSCYDDIFGKSANGN